MKLLSCIEQNKTFKIQLSPHHLHLQPSQLHLRLISHLKSAYERQIQMVISNPTKLTLSIIYQSKCTVKITSRKICGQSVLHSSKIHTTSGSETLQLPSEIYLRVSFLNHIVFHCSQSYIKCAFDKYFLNYFHISLFCQ